MKKTRVLLGLVAILAVFGCRDNIDDFNPDPRPPINPPPINMEFNASAFVEVVDTDGEPIEGAGITLGSVSLTTDEFGIARLDDVEMSTATYLTVDKVGYFHGSRRFYPTEDRTSHVRIVLMEQVVQGQIAAASGGVVNVEGNASLSFPANAISDANGNPFSGNVNVYAASIPADDPELSERMPGDLVGQTLTGTQGALASMGMMVVELRSDAGEELQVSEGSSVEMRMNVPASMQSSAPATIPMWHFDETAGLWIEEGEASLNGSEYVANVEHFTYWNYDAWFPIVKWGASFVFENGAPATQLSVCITILSMEARKCSFTDEEGAVCGLVAADELLLLEVVDPCGEVIYSQEVGPFSDSTTLGPITLPETAVLTTNVSGNAVDCDGNPVTDGFVRVTTGNQAYFSELDEQGNFELDAINCSESDVTVTIIDEGNVKQSIPQTFAYAPVVDAGTIEVCETISELIILNIEDPDTSITLLFPSARLEPGSDRTIITTEPDSTTGGQSFFYLDIPGQVTGVYPDCGLELVIFDQNQGGLFVSAGPVEVELTFVGDVGDYVIGTISGEVSSIVGGITSPFTGTFNALRQ